MVHPQVGRQSDESVSGLFRQIGEVFVAQVEDLCKVTSANTASRLFRVSNGLNAGSTISGISCGFAYFCRTQYASVNWQ